MPSKILKNKLAKRREKRQQEFLACTKLWRLLEIALEDLVKAEKSPKCEVNMTTWLSERANGKCAVCLAGSVMRMEFSATTNSDFERVLEAHGDWGSSLGNRLDALNELRRGDVWSASEMIGHPPATLRVARELDRHIADYHQHRKLWWEEIKQLLADLKREDL